MLHAIINTVSHSLCKIKKTKFYLLKPIYFCFKTPIKQMFVFSRTRLGKNLTGQKKSSAMWVPGPLKALGAQMGYPIGVPIWVLQKNKSIKIIDNIVQVINNNKVSKQSKLPKITWVQS